MFRRTQPLIATGMVILYAGMMLLGQSLHELLGCEHHHSHLTVVHPIGVSETGETLSSGDAGAEDAHDPETCPLCQFHAQGQLTPSLVGGELWQSVTPAAPVDAPLPFVVCARSVHAPRPPPSV
jgi:hypothetical protein